MGTKVQFKMYSLVRIIILLLISLGSKVTPQLILSPLINQGKLEEARDASLLKNYSKVFGPTEVESYSGFLTVDEFCNSNLFFWFFQNENKSEPLILWHGGGPGSSGLSALFREHGPYFIKEDGNVSFRSLAWTGKRSVIYVDSPIGTGFSYHNGSEECRVKTSAKAGVQMLSGLLQFFQMFPHLQPNDFYIISGSYGGKIVPSIAHQIHKHNKRKCRDPYPRINLKGFLLASGFTDPISQIDYGDFYYSYGIIDGQQRDYFRQRESLAKANINQGNWSAAFEIIEPLILGLRGEPSHLKNISGITFPYNMLINKFPEVLRRHVNFLNRKDVKNILQVLPATNYSSSSLQVYHDFKEDIYQSVKQIIEELLDSGEYKILFVSNQLDLVVPHSTIANFINVLSFEKEAEFRREATKIWEYKGVVRGYLKGGDNLAYLFLRGSGHLWVYDQPQVAYQVMTLFTNGTI